MADYSIRTKDGITIEGIPSQIPKDDDRLKRLVSGIRSTRGPTRAPGVYSYSTETGGGQPSDATGQEPQGAARTDLAGMLGGAIRGAGPIAAGAALGAAAGAPFGGVGAVPGAIAGAGITGAVIGIGDPLVSAINRIFGTKYSQPSDALNDLFTRLGVPQPDTEAERVMQAVAQGAAAAGGSAGLGRTVANVATNPLVKGVGQALAAQPVSQIAGGMGAGAGGQIAQELGASAPVQIAASLGGSVVGAGLAGLRPGTTGTTPALIGDAEKVGVRVLTSDVRPPKTFAGRWLQAMSEKIPYGGTGGTRAAQQTERVAAVRNVLRDFGADTAAGLSDDVMDDLLRTRSAALGKWTQAKGEVIERLANGTPVPVNRAVQEIDNQVARLQSLRTKEMTPVIERLNDWKTAIQNQDLANVELLRKQLGESFKAPELAAVRSTGEKAVSSIYGALREDMGDYIKQAGGAADYTKWQVANRELSNLAGELKVSSLAAVLKNGEATPEVVNKLLLSSKPSEVRLLYNNLSDEGRASARAAILARAAEKSGDALSPDRFVNEVKRLGASVGVMFEGGDLDQMKGLVRVLDATKRAGQAPISPPTGVQNVLPVATAGLASLFGGGIEGFVGAIGTAYGFGTMARIYESKPVRNLLISISQTVRGSTEEAALLKRLISVTATQKDALESSRSQVDQFVNPIPANLVADRLKE